MKRQLLSKTAIMALTLVVSAMPLLGRIEPGQQAQSDEWIKNAMAGTKAANEGRYEEAERLSKLVLAEADKDDVKG